MNITIDTTGIKKITKDILNRNKPSNLENLNSIEILKI